MENEKCRIRYKGFLDRKKEIDELTSILDLLGVKITEISQSLFTITDTTGQEYEYDSIADAYEDWEPFFKR